MIDGGDVPSAVGPARPERTRLITRAARRYFAALGAEGVPEFAVARGLRADLALLGRDGAITIVEVKSGIEDYRADRKWRGYAEWCDRLYFAVDLDFPAGALLDAAAPDGIGVVRVDGVDAAELAPAANRPLAPARRKALTLRLALAAAERLRRADDPGLAAFG